MIKEKFLIFIATYHSMYYDEYKFTILTHFQNFVTTLLLNTDCQFRIVNYSELKCKSLPLEMTYTKTEVCSLQHNPFYHRAIGMTDLYHDRTFNHTTHPKQFESTKY